MNKNMIIEFIDHKDLEKVEGYDGFIADDATYWYSRLINTFITCVRDVNNDSSILTNKYWELINEEFIPKIHIQSNTDLDRIMIPLHHLYIILTDMVNQAVWEKITIEILERNKIIINFGYIYISVMVNNDSIIQYIAGKGRISYSMLYTYEDPLIDPTWWK